LIVHDRETKDTKNPDLTINKESFPREESEEIDDLVHEEEDLEELKSKIEFEKIRKEEEKEMGILFLDIDNSMDTKQCVESSKSVLGTNKLESCLGFCHKYSIWYFDNKMYRDISLMNTMFDLISKKIIGKNLEYTVNPPDPDLVGTKSVQFKYEQFNFMDSYSYIYGEEGVDLDKFIGDY